MGSKEGNGSGSSRLELFDRSSRREMQRLKSGRGDAVIAFMRMLTTTSGL